jgi:hypothetical protein
MEMKQKKKKSNQFFFQKWPFFKLAILKNRQFSKNVVKILWIGPWVGRID